MVCNLNFLVLQHQHNQIGDPAPGAPSPGGGWFGGGGAGSAPGTVTTGGYGGGADGRDATWGDNGPGNDAQMATGGGGSGAFGNPHKGGNGGSGICIVKYQIGSIAAEKATGGNVYRVGTKTVHTFTATGEFQNTTDGPLTVDYVVIAGGGGGGGRNTGGGGGAGGVRSNIPGFMPTTTAIPAVGPGAPNKLTVTIGGGGAGGAAITRAPGGLKVDLLVFLDQDP